jgi:hypothetical protein
MKITALEESSNFATLNTETLFSKLKSHELSCKGHLNHDASLTSKALISSAHVGGHDANPTNTISSSLEFALSSHLLWSLHCHLLLQLLMNSVRASPTMRLPYWQESFMPCTSSARRGGGHPRAALSAATPDTSSPTAPRGRSSTPPTNTTTPTKTTPTTRATTRRSTTSETRRSTTSEDHVFSVCCLA